MTSAPAKPFPPGGRRLRALAETLGLVAAMLVIVALVHTFVLQPFTIPSGSMAPGLLTGDYILVAKWPYGWSRASPPVDLPGPPGRLAGRTPRRGDVVVFRLPWDRRQIWVKRVVGLPGDRVQVSRGVVRVDGRPLVQAPLGPGRDADDPARAVRRVRETGADGRTRVIQRGAQDGPGADTGVYVVPPGDLFVMGDNRDNSADRRFPAGEGVGLLPIDDVLRRIERVLLSWRPGAALLKPWTWLDLRPDRVFRRVG